MPPKKDSPPAKRGGAAAKKGAAVAEKKAAAEKKVSTTTSTASSSSDAAKYFAPASDAYPGLEDSPLGLTFDTLAGAYDGEPLHHLALGGTHGKTLSEQTHEQCLGFSKLLLMQQSVGRLLRGVGGADGIDAAPSLPEALRRLAQTCKEALRVEGVRIWGVDYNSLGQPRALWLALPLEPAGDALRGASLPLAELRSLRVHRPGEHLDFLLRPARDFYGERLEHRHHPRRLRVEHLAHAVLEHRVVDVPLRLTRSVA